MHLAKTDLVFPGLRARRESIRGVVVHWTGGIRRGPGVYQTLRARQGPKSPRGLSVHYVIDPDGTTWQFAPDDRTCLHAGAVNGWTIGIEVVSAGLPHNAIHAAELDRGIVRPLYAAELHGRKRALLGFTEPQYNALFLLLDVLTERHNLPRQVPASGSGLLLTRVMTKPELATYSGVLGHYHVSKEKLDPGTRPLEMLQERWR